MKRHTVLRLFTAAVWGGMSGAPVAVVLWPLVVIATGQPFSASAYLFAGATAVFLVAGLTCLVLALVAGFPLLLVLAKWGTFGVWKCALAGTAVGIVFALAAWPRSLPWPLVFFTAGIGCSCGAVAGKKSRPNLSVQLTSASKARAVG